MQTCDVLFCWNFVNKQLVDFFSTLGQIDLNLSEAAEATYIAACVCVCVCVCVSVCVSVCVCVCVFEEREEGWMKSIERTYIKMSDSGDLRREREIERESERERERERETLFV
jgi:hypothetical protein